MAATGRDGPWQAPTAALPSSIVDQPDAFDPAAARVIAHGSRTSEGSARNEGVA
jgi:hypothetical protein